MMNQAVSAPRSLLIKEMGYNRSLISGVTADSVPTSPFYRHSEVLETEVLEKKFLFILTINDQP